MTRKRTLYITGAVILASILIATASSIFHRPIPKAEPLKDVPARLNVTITNADSDIPELAGLDKRIRIMVLFHLVFFHLLSYVRCKSYF